MSKNNDKLKIKNLDRIDKRILSELDQNSRQSLSDIARKLRLGRDIITYRFERLKSEGILRSFVTALNPYALGFTIFKTYLKLEPQPTRINKLISILKKHPRLVWLGQSDGAWDLMIGMLGKSGYEYYDVEADLFERFEGTILQWETSTLVETHVYNRQFFSETNNLKYITIGGTPSFFDLDELEKKLLAILALDARTSIVSLAERLNATVDVVRYRIERLEKAGVITGYRADINLSKIDFIFVKAMISLRSWETESLNKFEEYCRNTKYVTYFVRQIGRFQVELEFEVDGYVHYYEILDQIKQAFPKLIRSVETAFMREEYYKWDFK